MTKSFIVGPLAGVVATLAVAPVDKILGFFISDRHKQRERALREGSPHDVAGKKIGERLAKRSLGQKEKKRAQLAFTLKLINHLAWNACAEGILRLADQPARHEKTSLLLKQRPGAKAG